MKTVTCDWCKNPVLHRQLQRHFREDCSGTPPLMPDQKICSSCQCLFLIRFFPISTSKKAGRDNTCVFCHSQRAKLAGKPDPHSKEIRPGRWVLRECPFGCGEQFNARQMLRHKPRCPKKPPTQHRAMKDLPVMSGMAETHAARDVERATKIRNLKFAHNMTIEEWDTLYAAQKGLCAICGRPPEGLNRRTDSLHVDHDHATNKNRGLLCHFCNVGLGHFRESIPMLQSAIEYLQTHCT